MSLKLFSFAYIITILTSYHYVNQCGFLVTTTCISGQINLFKLRGSFQQMLSTLIRRGQVTNRRHLITSLNYEITDLILIEPWEQISVIFVANYKNFIKKNECENFVCKMLFSLDLIIFTYVLSTPSWKMTEKNNMYESSDINCATVEVWEWICNFISHFIRDVITYPCWYWN